MKLPITEVIENVKDELLCYEGCLLYTSDAADEL